MWSVGVGGMGVCCRELSCWMLGPVVAEVGVYYSYCFSNAMVYIASLLAWEKVSMFDGSM